MTKSYDIDDLWSDSPRDRLRIARGLDRSVAETLRKEVASSSPMKPWPYGMATTVNPFLIVLGPSPGNSPHIGDTASVQRPPYEEPTVGYAHPGFYYQDAEGYWERIRQLSVGIIRGFDAGLSEEDCYALSGQMNLGVGAFGKATKDAIEPAYTRWVPKVLMEALRPRIVILVGLLSILQNCTEVQENFLSSGATSIDWKRPSQELPFMSYQKKRLRFRAWEVSRPDGQITAVISWPNHPCRAPMTNTDIWRGSIREAVDYFAA